LRLGRDSPAGAALTSLQALDSVKRQSCFDRKRIMEIHDGFIVGIFNYCDRWCETCAFTSRCRLFADMTKHEAELDPQLQAIVEAPLLPQDMPPPPPRWLEEVIEQANKIASEPMSEAELAVVEPLLRRDHQEIDGRAAAYCKWVHAWLGARDQKEGRDAEDPVAVIVWFASLNASKIHRALMGLAEDAGERDYPSDHEGSAKVALIGIERSRAAWLQLVAEARGTGSTAAPRIADLEWLQQRLETLFPAARSFIRPGFDEPDEVATLFD
jgi:hypothetical protein